MDARMLPCLVISKFATTQTIILHCLSIDELNEVRVCHPPWQSIWLSMTSSKADDLTPPGPPPPIGSNLVRSRPSMEPTWPEKLPNYSIAPPSPRFRNPPALSRRRYFGRA